MNTMTPTELLTLWKQEQIAVEMTTGHLLQNLVKQQSTIESLTVLVGKLRVDMDRLIAQNIANQNASGRQNKPIQA